MTPEQFLTRIAKHLPAPVYLFAGPEAYLRRKCKEALAARVLGAQRAGLTQTDLENTTFADVLDDARSLSLFASERLIWVSSAELALPRRMAAADEENTDASAAALGDYLKQPTPGTVLVFDCSRYDFAGDDRPKLERVMKFYAAIPAAVEFRRLTPESSRYLCQDLAKERGLKLAGRELAALVDAAAGDANRLAAEIEKLSLFAGSERSITMGDLRALVPNAAESTIFELVQALGKRDRNAALRSVQVLVREGEYLPMALSFLSTQFRMALAAKEAKVSTGQQAQNFFTNAGVRIWRERAEQIAATAAAFSKDDLEGAVSLIYETDKRFRDGYRDDRTTMERLVLGLTVES